jgi:hypothetical protein
MTLRVAGIWIALLLAPLAHAQDAFVVPNASEAVEGDSNNTIPFTSAGGNVRYQQVYLDGEIPPGPFTIYGIAFRPDALQGSFAFEIPDVDIYLGTTGQGTSLNSEFDLNVDLETLVASGPLVLASAASGPIGGPLAFDIEIWFDQPYVYEGGNLLLDVSVQPYGSNGTPIFDAVNIGADPVGRAFSAGASGGSVTASSGTTDTQGLVTKFMLAPEPAGSAFAGLATLASLLRARRRGARISPSALRSSPRSAAPGR